VQAKIYKGSNEGKGGKEEPGRRRTQATPELFTSKIVPDH
jgi:hypothetical protein